MWVLNHHSLDPYFRDRVYVCVFIYLKNVHKAADTMPCRAFFSVQIYLMIVAASFHKEMKIVINNNGIRKINKRRSSY